MNRAAPRSRLAAGGWQPVRLHALAAVLVLAVCAPPAWPDSASSGTGAWASRTASVNLDFQISIDKFIYFGIGGPAWPGTGGAVPVVGFTVTPSIPGVPTVPATGSNASVNWSGAAPGFSVAASNNVLPVQVRSNAGQVQLHATATTPFVASGPPQMSAVSIASSDTALPAPPIPNTGSGATVNVTGGGGAAINSLVTLREADWTFSYAHNAATPAGAYSGTITFTASVP